MADHSNERFAAGGRSSRPIAQAPPPRHSVAGEVLGLALWLLLTFATAATAGLASAGVGGFYQQLARPDWAPPAWLFAPVWAVLYLMMGVAAWLVWRAHGLRAAGGALALYALQLAANALWTWLFFVWQRGGLALAEILLLGVLVAGTTVAFWRRQALAGALLLPYLAWVTFACALTYATWKLNPSVLGS